jgi:hypothetical protein
MLRGLSLCLGIGLDSVKSLNKNVEKHFKTFLTG